MFCFKWNIIMYLQYMVITFWSLKISKKQKNKKKSPIKVVWKYVTIQRNLKLQQLHAYMYIQCTCNVWRYMHACAISGWLIIALQAPGRRLYIFFTHIYDVNLSPSWHLFIKHHGGRKIRVISPVPLFTPQPQSKLCNAILKPYD